MGCWSDIDIDVTTWEARCVYVYLCTPNLLAGVECCVYLDADPWAARA